MLSDPTKSAPLSRDALLEVADVTASNADATRGEPIFKDGVGIGRVTFGAYGYTAGMSFVLGFVKGATAGEEVDVMVLGKPHKARILAEPLFDASRQMLFDASGKILRG